MQDDTFVFLANTDAVPAGRCVAFEAGGHSVLVCHVAGAFHAVENQCSHACEPLAGGRLRGSRIICPVHGGSFDVRDGRATGRPATRPVRTYALRITDGRIEVSLPRD